MPRLDPATGGLDPGVADDFPNGGGNRAFLFVVDAPGGRFSWFFQNSASAVDLDVPIVVGGKNYGAPIENLKAAIKDAGLDVGRSLDRHRRRGDRASGCCRSSSRARIFPCTGTASGRRSRPASTSRSPIRR